MAEIYFSGQGIVYTADRDTNGNVTVFRDLGNVPALRVALETDTIEHKESRTGQRLTDFRLTREKRARVTMTLESFTKANLMMLLYGTTTAITASSVTNEVLPTFAVGDVVPLAHIGVSSVVFSSGVSPTNYTIDAKAGMITIVSLTGVTQPVDVDYSYTGASRVQLFKTAAKERFLRFAGLNTANGDAGVVVELYRVLFDPVGNLDLINDELAQFEIEGSVLYDSARDTDAQLGGFGRVILPA